MWTLQRKVSKPAAAPAYLETWAMHRVGAGTGALMLLAQDANRVLRHCRIGRVTAKP